MTTTERFKIDRSQRMHGGAVTLRVYQVFGTDQFGWDSNREDASVDRPLQTSRSAAERDADEALRRTGHVCDEGCYPWRALM